jgi:hypothetical protein
MSARKGEALPRLGGAGGGASRVGGKGTSRTPKPQTGKSKQPIRSRPSQIGRQPIDESLFQGEKKPQQFRDKTAYLERVAQVSSARQLAQETKRVNAEIRATGTFTEPMGNILKGLEAGADERVAREREQQQRKPSREPTSRAGSGGAGKVTLGPRALSQPQPEPEPYPEPEPQFRIPSGKFEVDRIGRGSNVDEFEEPLVRRRPTTEGQPVRTSDPFASIGGVSQIQQRLRTGGSSGGLPTQRSAPSGGRTTQEILEQQRSNFIAGAGLQRGRSVDTAEASGELSAGAQILLKQREERLARELSSQPLGREQTATP